MGLQSPSKQLRAPGVASIVNAALSSETIVWVLVAYDGLFTIAISPARCDLMTNPE